MAYKPATPEEDKITTARVAMLLREPFFGNLATRLKIVDGSGWVPTAATDGKHLYYNKDFIMSLDPEEMIFLIAHEVMHCVYDHMDRRGSRDPKLWNCAADFVINYELVECGFKLITSNGIKPCYDTKYAGMSSEEVYQHLLDSGEGGDSGSGDGGKGLKNGMAPIDEHMDPSDSEEEEGDGEDETGYNGPIPMTDDERSSMEDAIKQAVIEASKQADPSGKGVPGRVKRMVADLTEPKITWDEYLNKTIQSSFISDFTWARSARKTRSQGIYLPAVDRDCTITVVVGIDTSGSIYEEKFRAFLSEVHGMMSQFASFELVFFCWDTECYTLQRFTEDNADEILQASFEGCGGNDGTQFVWDYLEENDIEPDNMVMFTDGYILGPEYTGTPPDYADNITWVMWGSDIVMELGTTVFYDKQ